MMKENAENDEQSSLVPQLKPHDFEDSPGASLPKGTEIVGEIAHHHETPNFTSVSVLLAADHDVLPGQFLLAWHGKRQANVATVIQVGDCTEVNPNEMPEL